MQIIKRATSPGVAALQTNEPPRELPVILVLLDRGMNSVTGVLSLRHQGKTNLEGTAKTCTDFFFRKESSGSYVTQSHGPFRRIHPCSRTVFHESNERLMVKEVWGMIFFG